MIIGCFILGGLCVAFIAEFKLNGGSFNTPADRTHAPPPRARYPADAEGWTDALVYAGSKHS